jgi:hypothetical protein
VYSALLPFVQTQIAPPPEEEMPVLSLAAREQMVGIGVSPSSMSGSFRQDSAILRAEIMQRSGRMVNPLSGRMPTATLSGSKSGIGRQRISGGGGSSAINSPFNAPPPSKEQSSRGAGRTTETKRISSQNERTAVSDQRSSKSSRFETPKGLLSNSVFRVLVEAALVTILLLLVWWVYTLFH